MTPHDEERRSDYIERTLERQEGILDRIQSTASSLQTACALLEKRIRDVEERERPCSWFVEHKQEHEKMMKRRNGFFDNIGASVVICVFSAFLGALLAKFGFK